MEDFHLNCKISIFVFIAPLWENQNPLHLQTLEVASNLAAMHYNVMWCVFVFKSGYSNNDVHCRYMYAGKIDNLNTRSPRLLEAADKYQLSELKEICEVSLKSGISYCAASGVFVCEKSREKANLHHHFNFIRSPCATTSPWTRAWSASSWPTSTTLRSSRTPPSSSWSSTVRTSWTRWGMLTDLASTAPQFSQHENV